MAERDGGPAFACERDHVFPYVARQGGITLRQYYKAALSTGIAVGDDIIDIEKFAAYVGRVADALLAEDEARR